MSSSVSALKPRSNLILLCAFIGSVRSQALYESSSSSEDVYFVPNFCYFLSKSCKRLWLYLKRTRCYLVSTSWRSRDSLERTCIKLRMSSPVAKIFVTFSLKIIFLLFLQQRLECSRFFQDFIFMQEILFTC